MLIHTASLELIHWYEKDFGGKMCGLFVRYLGDKLTSLSISPLSVWFYASKFFFPQRHCSVMNYDHFRTMRHSESEVRQRGVSLKLWTHFWPSFRQTPLFTLWFQMSDGSEMIIIHDRAVPLRKKGFWCMTSNKKRWNRKWNKFFAEIPDKKSPHFPTKILLISM